MKIHLQLCLSMALLSSIITISAASNDESPCQTKSLTLKDNILILPAELQHKIATYVLGGIIKHDIFDRESSTLMNCSLPHIPKKVIFNPQKTLLACGHEQEPIQFWDVLSGKLHHTLQGNAQKVYALNAENSLMAYSPNNKNIQLQNINTGEVYKDLGYFGNGIISAMFNLNGTTLAVNIEPLALNIQPNGIILCDINSGEKSHNLLGVNRPALTAMAFNPQGTLIAASYGSSFIVINHVDSGEIFKGLQADSPCPIQSIDFNPQGTHIAAVGNDSIRIWDVDSGKLLKKLDYNNARFTSINFNPQGTQIAAVGCDHRYSDSHDSPDIQIWDIDSGKLSKTINCHRNSSFSTNIAVFNNNGGLIVCDYRNNRIRLFDQIDYHEAIWNMNFEQVMWIYNQYQTIMQDSSRKSNNTIFEQVMWIYNQYQTIMQDSSRKSNNTISEEEKKTQIINKIKIEKSIDHRIISQLCILKNGKQA